MQVRTIITKAITIGMALMALNTAVLPFHLQNLPSKQVQISQTSQTSQSSQENILHINTKLVTFPVTVADHNGRLIAGLNKENFEVLDNKVKQNIEFFTTEDLPMSVALIFDLSGSMSQRVYRSLNSLREFIKTGNDKDEYCLITFNNSAKIAVDFTNSAEKIINTLAIPETEGRTALYDAIYVGIEKIKQGHLPKKVLLILSDGQDNNSRYSLDEIRRLAQESDSLIYAIGIVDRYSNDIADKQGGWILEELTSMTGGKTFFPSTDSELQETISKIMLELRRQYSIGFTPTTNSDGKWHKLNIKLKLSKELGHLSVRGRQGYFAKD